MCKLESNLKWYKTNQTRSSSQTGGTTLKCHWSLSLTTYSLDRFPGTLGCTYTHIKNYHAQATASLCCVLSFARLLHTSAVNYLFSFVLRGSDEAGGTQKHQTTKKVSNNATILASSAAAVYSSSSSSPSLPLCPPPPPPPPSTFTLPHRISLSSALESSSVSAQSELHSEKTWRQRSRWDVGAAKHKGNRGSLSCRRHGSSNFRRMLIGAFVLPTGENRDSRTPFCARRTTVRR